MEETIKVLKLVEEEDDSGWSVRAQEIYDGDKMLFHVWDLTDCPEDATIDRSLFSAHQWLQAVRYGMELARHGYTGVGLEVEKING